MTELQTCPTIGCKGTLVTYKTKTRSTGKLERSRECDCCGYRDIVLVRPALVIKQLRIVRSGSLPTQDTP